MPDLKTTEKVANHLVFAVAVVLVAGTAEECAQFVFADVHVGEGEDFQRVFGIQVQSDLYLPEDDVVGQFALRLGLWAVLFAATIVDKPIEKGRKQSIAAIQMRRVVEPFQQIADFCTRDLMIRRPEQRDHFRIAQVENVTNTTFLMTAVDQTVSTRWVPR